MTGEADTMKLPATKLRATLHLGHVSWSPHSHRILRDAGDAVDAVDAVDAGRFKDCDSWCVYDFEKPESIVPRQKSGLRQDFRIFDSSEAKQEKTVSLGNCLVYDSLMENSWVSLHAIA